MDNQNKPNLEQQEPAGQPITEPSAPPPATPQSQPATSSGKNWKKWILICLAIGAMIYVGVYYLVLSKQDSKSIIPPVKKVTPPVPTGIPIVTVTAPPPLSCTPRPACLDAKTPCLMPEDVNMCPKTPVACPAAPVCKEGEQLMHGDPGPDSTIKCPIYRCVNTNGTKIN